MAIAVMGCAGSPASETHRGGVDAPRLIAEPWLEADTRFTADAQWLGGDGALSIPLGADRTLWLFGDSFVADGSLPPAERPGRTGSVMARNSIALQEGADLATAKLRFYARSDAQGRPSAFFEDGPETWLWPGHGLHAEGRIIVFMHRMRVDEQPGGLGFVPVEHIVLSITRLEQPPPLWEIERLEMPALPSAGLVGAAVLREGEHVYAFGVRDPGDRALTLVRWDAARFVRGELAEPELWTDDGFARTGECAALIAPVSTELSVTRDPRGADHGFVLVTSRGFGIAPIELRFARAVTGPWSAPSTIDITPYVVQADAGSTIAYAAKAHPEQRGAEWIVTYAVNSLDPTRIWRDLSIYYPRVLRVRRAPRRRALSAPPELRCRAWRCSPARARERPARSRTTCAASA